MELPIQFCRLRFDKAFKTFLFFFFYFYLPYFINIYYLCKYLLILQTKGEIYINLAGSVSPFKELSNATIQKRSLINFANFAMSDFVFNSKPLQYLKYSNEEFKTWRQFLFDEKFLRKKKSVSSVFNGI